MKKVFAFVFPTAMMLLLCNHLNAQNVRITNYEQMTNTFASVNGASVLASNVYVLDSIDTQYNGFHIASFDVNLGGNEITKKMLVDLQTAAAEKPLQELVLVKQTPTGKPLEQRTYGSVSVKEIRLPEFNSSSNELARIRITIQAQTVMITDNATVMIAGNPERRNTVNAFKLSIGSLPTQRVSRVSGLKLIPGQYQYFTIDVASTDAKTWNTWLRNSLRGGKKEYGTLTLFDQAMSMPVMSFNLTDIEIASISASPAQESSAKITVGLRALLTPGK